MSETRATPTTAPTAIPISPALPSPSLLSALSSMLVELPVSDVTVGDVDDAFVVLGIVLGSLVVEGTGNKT